MLLTWGVWRRFPADTRRATVSPISRFRLAALATEHHGNGPERPRSSPCRSATGRASGAVVPSLDPAPRAPRGRSFFLEHLGNGPDRPRFSPCRSVTGHASGTVVPSLGPASVSGIGACPPSPPHHPDSPPCLSACPPGPPRSPSPGPTPERSQPLFAQGLHEPRAAAGGAVWGPAAARRRGAGSPSAPFNCGHRPLRAAPSPSPETSPQRQRERGGATPPEPRRRCAPPGAPRGRGPLSRSTLQRAPSSGAPRDRGPLSRSTLQHAQPSPPPERATRAPLSFAIASLGAAPRAGARRVGAARSEPGAPAHALTLGAAISSPDRSLLLRPKSRPAPGSARCATPGRRSAANP